MSMFGDGTNKERIYEELNYLYKDYYKDQWDSPEGELTFVMDVLESLHVMFGDW